MHRPESGGEPDAALFTADRANYAVCPGAVRSCTRVARMPEPTGRDGADLSAIQIIAMGIMAFNGTIEETTDPGTLRALALVRYGGQSPESLRKAGRGNGMLVEYRVGSKGGVVIAAGSTEWILGLRPHIERNEPVDTDAALITQNVLNRAISRATPASRL